MRKAQRLYVFLKTRRNVLLVPPEAIPFDFGSDRSKELLNLLELLASSRCGACSARGIVLVSGRDFVCDYAMKEKYDFLREVGNVSARLYE